MNRTKGVKSTPRKANNSSENHSNSITAGAEVTFWSNLLDSLGDFASWLQNIFGSKRPGDVTAAQLLKAMKKEQMLLVFVMALSMSAVMFTVYMQER